MREVGAFEAETQFRDLLDLVEKGEQFAITRNGKEVARLVPARSNSGSSEAHAAVARIRARAEQRKLGPFDWAEWKAYRDEGRP